jgi:enamine deaminase RidA (YjgF/YER057c/UK114 family)
VDEGYQAARICALNSLAQIKAELGTLEAIKKFVRVMGFVNCTEDFPDQPKVVNGASELFLTVFGEKGRHTRLALGANSLPRNAAVELEVLVEI